MGEGQIVPGVISLLEWLEDLDPTLAAAIVAAFVAIVTTMLSTPLRYFVDKRALRHRLRLEYEHEQRKNLRALIGRYLGRTLEAAETFNHRMWNLYKSSVQEAYLDVGGDYTTPHYYLDSMVHRFLALCVLVRSFEREALFLDPRVAEEQDIQFTRLQKALRWTMTDVELFAGLPYESRTAKDHFFTDYFRQACDSATIDGETSPLDSLRWKQPRMPLCAKYTSSSMASTRRKRVTDGIA